MKNLRVIARDNLMRQAENLPQQREPSKYGDPSTHMYYGDDTPGSPRFYFMTEPTNYLGQNSETYNAFVLKPDRDGTYHGSPTNEWTKQFSSREEAEGYARSLYEEYKQNGTFTSPGKIPFS